jgi:hypothetical protein
MTDYADNAAIEDNEKAKAKRGRPRKITATPLGYGKQTRVNHLVHEFMTAVEHKDGTGARKILDDLEELLESALE